MFFPSILKLLSQQANEDEVTEELNDRKKLKKNFPKLALTISVGDYKNQQADIDQKQEENVNKKQLRDEKVAKVKGNAKEKSNVYIQSFIDTVAQRKTWGGQLKLVLEAIASLFLIKEEKKSIALQTKADAVRILTDNIKKAMEWKILFKY
jgi:hypothetical protein